MGLDTVGHELYGLDKEGSSMLYSTKKSIWEAISEEKLLKGVQRLTFHNATVLPDKFIGNEPKDDFQWKAVNGFHWGGKYAFLYISILLRWKTLSGCVHLKITSRIGSKSLIG